MSWPRGGSIVLRNRRLGRISYVFPLTVVEDAAEFSALYLAAGSPVK